MYGSIPAVSTASTGTLSSTCQWHWASGRFNSCLTMAAKWWSWRHRKWSKMIDRPMASTGRSVPRNTTKWYFRRMSSFSCRVQCGERHRDHDQVSTWRQWPEQSGHEIEPQMLILSGDSWSGCFTTPTVSKLTHLLTDLTDCSWCEIVESSEKLILTFIARTLGGGGFYGGGHVGLESNTYNPHDNEWRNDPTGVIISLLITFLNL